MKSVNMFLAGILLFTVTSCYYDGGRIGIRGEGPVVERKISLDNFNGISLPGSANIFLTQGNPQEVRIVGQENIIDNLDLEVKGEVWDIGNKKPVWHSEPVNIYITVESLRLARISGSGSIKMMNHFGELRDLDLKISGSGKMDLDLDARQISANISGSGDLHLRGSASTLDLHISGSGGILATDLTAERVETRISGSGGMELNVEKRLDVHISGSGSVVYEGNPKLNSNISGSGRVRSR